MELALAVFPEPAAFVEPGEGALDDPAFRHHRELVQFAAPDNLDLGAEKQRHALRKGCSRISAIDQQFDHGRQRFDIEQQHPEGAVAIGHVGRGHLDCVRQALRIDRHMALDARDFFACVIAQAAGKIFVLKSSLSGW